MALPVAPRAVQGVNPGEAPSPRGKARTQDIIISLALKGEVPGSIATMLGIEEEAVDKVLQSEWATEELNRIAKQDPEKRDTVRNLIRMHAFTAVLVVAKVMKDEKVGAQTRLAAARTLLEYSLTTAKDKDAGERQQAVLSVDAIAKEVAELDKRIERAKELVKKPI